MFFCVPRDPELRLREREREGNRSSLRPSLFLFVLRECSPRCGCQPVVVLQLRRGKKVRVRLHEHPCLRARDPATCHLPPPAPPRAVFAVLPPYAHTHVPLIEIYSDEQPTGKWRKTLLQGFGLCVMLWLGVELGVQKGTLWIYNPAFPCCSIILRSENYVVDVECFFVPPSSFLHSLPHTHTHTIYGSSPNAKLDEGNGYQMAERKNLQTPSGSLINVRVPACPISRACFFLLANQAVMY